MTRRLSLALLVALAAAPSGAAEPDTPDDDEQEILVIANKLEKITLDIKRDINGRYHCAAVQSTGLEKLDSQLCAITVSCIRKNGWVNDVVKHCVEQRKPALLDTIRDQLRRQRREGTLAEGGGA